MSIINDYGFPFTSVNKDRTYSSDDWRAFFVSLFFNGVIDGVMNELQVKPQAVPNKTVFVETGSLLINGAILSNTSTKTVAVAENISGEPRIDRVVARLNLTDRKIEFAVIQGIPAVSPVAPSLTRNADIYEMSLAKVSLANGYSTIVAGNITDERLDETVCGFSKTAYMQTFDDENNLLKYNRDVITVDGGGNPTEVQYKRPSDSTLFLKRTMSNPHNENYQTITEEFYKADGVTVYKTVIYSLTYLPNKMIDTMSRVVS